MRMNRIITAIIAIAMVGFLPFVGASSANAKTGSPGTAVEKTAAGASERAAKPQRRMPSRIAQPNRRTLIFVGRVKPRSTTVTIQKKNCKAARCSWRKFKTVKTSKTGGYRVKIGAPRTGNWYWRAKSPSNSKFRVSYSTTYRTYTL